MNAKLLKLARMVMRFEETIIDENTRWIHDGELAVGIEVYTEKDGEMVPVEDGEYVIDNQKVTIKEGKVDSIEVTEPEDIVEEVIDEQMKKSCMEDQPQDTEQPQEDEKDLKIKELEGLLADRDAVIEELTQKIKELEDKAEAPKEEPIQMNRQIPSRENSGAIKYFG